MKQYKQKVAKDATNATNGAANGQGTLDGHLGAKEGGNGAMDVDRPANTVAIAEAGAQEESSHMDES